MSSVALKMFVADVKCSQATRQTVPNSRTGSAKASVYKAEDVFLVPVSCVPRAHDLDTSFWCEILIVFHCGEPASFVMGLSYTRDSHTQLQPLYQLHLVPMVMVKGCPLVMESQVKSWNLGRPFSRSGK